VEKTGGVLLVSFKSRYLEKENERLRRHVMLLQACLLERAGHRNAADMLMGQAKPVDPLPSGLEAKPNVMAAAASAIAVPAGRGFRAIRKFWQDQTKPEEKPNEPDRCTWHGGEAS
jgi:hypothetical protein